MATERTGRTKPSTTWSARPKFTKWIDYLLDHTGDRIQDDTGDDILIYSNSGFEEDAGWTTYTTRTKI